MRKTLGRRPAMIRLGSLLLSSYLKFVYVTQRWTIEGLGLARGVWADRSQGAILLLWHQGIPIAANAWPRHEHGQEMRALISRSSDGEFIAQVMSDLGYPAIRGSRQRKNSVGDKGGAEALRDMLKWIRSGGAVSITPDGPKGPARIMAEGPAVAARMSGAPVILVGLASKPCLHIKSWDRTILPLPFTRAAAVYYGPLKATRDDDPAALAADWTARLNMVQDRAEALVE
jgi:hypothetical protein